MGSRLSSSGGGSSTTDASALTSGTLPLARLSGITTSQLDAAAGITSGQIAALDAGKITTGTLPLARLSGITTSQMDAAAAITSGQIASLAASKITGTNTLPDGVLSTNVPLLNAGNTFTALQTIAASVAGPLAQINNSSTTGAGLVVGSTTVASAGAGKIAPALACTQTVPATANYALVSVGGAPWDGSTSGKFAGSASGTGYGGNFASGFSGNLADLQVNGSSKLSVDASGNTILGGGTAVCYVGTLRGSFGLTLTNSNNLASGDLLTGTTLGDLRASSGTQAGLKLALPLNQSGTAGYTGLLVSATETATGSGTKRLLDLQVGGASKASFDNTGGLAFTPATTTTAPGAGGAGALPATPAGYATVTIAGTARQIAYF